MITAEQLYNHGWFQEPKNKTIWYYDSWEYEFRITTQELYYINDGMGEPELVARVDSIDELKKIYYAIHGEEMSADED